MVKSDLLEAARASGQDRAVQEALAAGVDFPTILRWVFEYGPRFAEVVRTLLSQFRKDCPNCPPANSADGVQPS